MNITPKRFLQERDHTGRFIVKSSKTGIAYYVEPMDTNQRIDWGDVNPATGKTEGQYGAKYKGSIKVSESLITEEHGFKNITTLAMGESPLAYIEKVDEERYAEGYRPKAEAI